MKFLVIFSLLSIVFQSVGEEKNADIDAFLYPMVSTYASEIEDCDVDDLNINSLSDLKNICQGLIDSEICSNVKRKYLMNCNNLKNQMELQGVDQAEWPDTSSIDHMKSFWIYNEAEVNRLGNRNSEWTDFLTNFAKLQQEPEFSCLNKKGKMKLWRKYMRPLSQFISAISYSLLKSTFKPLQSFSGVKLAWNIFLYVTIPSAAVPGLDVILKLIGGPDVGMSDVDFEKIFDVGLISGMIIGLIMSASQLGIIGNEEDQMFWGERRVWSGFDFDYVDHESKKRKRQSRFNVSKAMNSIRKKKVR